MTGYNPIYKGIDPMKLYEDNGLCYDCGLPIEKCQHTDEEKLEEDLRAKVDVDGFLLLMAVADVPPEPLEFVDDWAGDPGWLKQCEDSGYGDFGPM